MNYFFKNHFCVLYIIILIPMQTLGYISGISLNFDGKIPARDLVTSNNDLLSPFVAGNLEISDSVLLNPTATFFYNGQNNFISDEDQVHFTNNEELTFVTPIESYGIFRFNAISGRQKLLTVYLDINLHSMLLRKNLLQRLGYIVPPIKYLKKVKVNFTNVEEVKKFKEKYVVNSAFAPAKKWIVAEGENFLILKDIAIANQEDTALYNVTLGIEKEDDLSNRTIRSLILPYHLTHVREEFDLYRFENAKLDNGKLLLDSFIETSFDSNTRIDDLVWMQNKINKLSRKDFEQIIKLAYFPDGLSESLVERMIANRNQLNHLLNIKKNDLKYNPNLKIKGIVEDGKVVKNNFPEYAPSFYSADTKTPLDELFYYLLGKIQSNLIDNADFYINQKLKVFNRKDFRSDYFKKQFEKGLKHFVETGELTPIKIGTWKSPEVDFKLITSRDIILGNFLGTNNAVQLADTFGVGMDLGYGIGVEGIGYNLSAFIDNKVTGVRTFTHVKPVNSLKQSFKEDYRNILVPYLKFNLKGGISSLAKNQDPKKDAEILKRINENLGEGESLIITDQIVPSTSLDVNYEDGILSAGGGIGVSYVILNRIHIYRRSATEIQIFDDVGRKKEIDLNYHLAARSFPIITLKNSHSNGTYNVDSYIVNIDTDLTKNSKLRENANALKFAIRDRRFSNLRDLLRPVNVKANFDDHSFFASLLFWRLKSLNGRANIEVTAKDGVNGRYFIYQNDLLFGLNLESITKEVANYYLQKEVDPNVSVSDEVTKNPGETFWGNAKVETLRFEAEENKNGELSKQFLTIMDFKQGWSISKNDLMKTLKEINEKFGKNLFNFDEYNFSAIKLYKLGFRINFYEKGIKRISEISLNEVMPFEQKNLEQAACPRGDVRKTSAFCGDFRMIKFYIKKCKEIKNYTEEKAICILDLVGQLYKDLSFSDFEKLIGANNFYLQGSVDGIRMDSPTVSETINSNGFGQIDGMFSNGPIGPAMQRVGLPQGEFNGSWIRESL